MEFVDSTNAAPLSSMPREMLSSTESLMDSASVAPSAPRNYYVNLEKFSNGAEIVDMLDGNLLNPLFHNKHFEVKLKVEINPLKKSSFKRKKTSLYTNNKYILFTQLISRLKLEWKSSNKMWSLMGVNPKTKKPFDENGYPLYVILSRIEAFHKEINEYDYVVQKDEHGVESTRRVLNIERSDRSRKHAVEYALAMLVAFYENSEVPRPDPDYKEADVLFNQKDMFKMTMDKFKLFVEQHRATAAAAAASSPTEERPRSSLSSHLGKVKKPINKPKLKKQPLTSEMVSDILEQQQQPAAQYTFSLN
ncbi:PP31/39K [Betabaculovirus altermyunipunctae]|uniref:PP31/39K n=1 Tax=Betabaculovirus altermyunipunctae TaxID=3051996 RepID=A0A1S5YDX8_9BBAC|nr:PP31/39K [Betabaculovirus altermyunipunctae]AQQ80319.1 PP31/39K [Betabaculovirus altermyunipunctae]